jgi:hypothetical protein
LAFALNGMLVLDVKIKSLPRASSSSSSSFFFFNKDKIIILLFQFTMYISLEFFFFNKRKTSKITTL